VCGEASVAAHVAGLAKFPNHPTRADVSARGIGVASTAWRRPSEAMLSTLEVEFMVNANQPEMLRYFV
jgi:hypothetical protein